MWMWMWTLDRKCFDDLTLVMEFPLLNPKAVKLSADPSRGETHAVQSFDGATSSRVTNGRRREEAYARAVAK